MTFLERDLEDIVFNASADMLKDRGLHSFMHNAHTYRQLQIGNYGIADIVQIRKYYDESMYARGFVLPCLQVSVFELKKDKVGVDTFMQAIRYCKGILEFIENRGLYGTTVNFKIVLIGRQIENGTSFSYLDEILCSDCFNLNVFTYSYDIDGITFTEKGEYSLVDDGLAKSLPFSKYKKTSPFVYKKREETLNTIEF